MDEFYLSDAIGLKRKELLGSDYLYNLDTEFELSQEDVEQYYSHSNYKKILVVVQDASQYELLDQIVEEINPNTDIDWDVSENGAIAKISKAIYSPISSKPFDIVISASLDLLKFCKELDPKIECIFVSTKSLEHLNGHINDIDDQAQYSRDYDLLYKKLNKSLKSKNKNKTLQEAHYEQI